MIEPIDDMSDLSPLVREAIAWVVCLHSGEATKADLEDIQRWRDRSPEHEQAFREAVRLWRRLKTAGSNLTQERQAGVSRLAAWRSNRWSPTRRAAIGGAIAASVAGYLLYEPPFELWPSLGELRADYRTGKGERRELSIVNDVAITLNTQTSLAVLSDAAESPRIALISGEAAISSRRVIDRPLTVEALDTRIIAARAAFNVRCVEGRVSITCIEGQVDVESDRNLVQLVSGQQVTVSNDKRIGTPFKVDTGETSAWRNGLLVVSDRPLSEVIAEVNRYRPGRIVITNSQLGQRLVNGTFHLDRLDNFPDQVQQLFGASVRTLPGGIVLLS